MRDLQRMVDYLLLARQKVRVMMDKGVQPEMLEAVVKSWVPMGEAGMNFWRRLFDASTGAK